MTITQRLKARQKLTRDWAAGKEVIWYDEGKWMNNSKYRTKKRKIMILPIKH